jgi:hypothetical protein
MSEKASDVIFVGNKPPMSYVLAINYEPLFREIQRNNAESPRPSDNYSGRRG